MTTKNLETYFQHAPAADLTALAAVNTAGIVNGVIIEVAAAGLFEFQTPAVATPDGRDVISGLGGGVWIRQTLPALKTTAGGSINFASGGTSAATQQLALDAIAGATTSTYYLRGNGTHVSMSAIQAGDVPTLNQDTSGTAAKATNIAAGTANQLPYQTAANTTSFISAAANAVLVTNGTNVPSLSTTPGDSIMVTDPTTSSSATLNTALSDIYSAIVPPAESAAGVSAVSLSVAVATPQIITGAEVILPPGKYLLSYSSSQTFTPTVANISTEFSATTFIYNTTAAANVAHTSFTALHGYAETGLEIFGGTASATIVATFGVTTTLDVYTQLNAAAVTGATFVADYATITAIRLANTQTTYMASGSLAADSTSTSPQIVTGAELILPAGNYLLSYSASQNLATLVGDVTTTFTAKSYVYDTTGAAVVTNTTYAAFSGYVETGSEIFGGTAAATVAVTLAVPTTLDVYVMLGAASAGTDTYTIVSEITAVKLD